MVLPCLVDMYGSDASPTYVVTKVGKGLDAGFVPGVVQQYWNGVPEPVFAAAHRQGQGCSGDRQGMASRPKELNEDSDPHYH